MITPNIPTPAPTTRSWIVMLTQLLCKLNLHHHWHVDHRCRTTDLGTAPFSGRSHQKWATSTISREPNRTLARRV